MPCVLCIDDNQNVLRLLADLLRKSGYATLSAVSGKQGLRLLRQHNPPDLVVLDYDMPEMRGDLVAREIRRHKPKLPIILFTGIPDQIPDSLKQSINAVVYKTDVDSLLVAVAKLTGTNECKA